MDRFEYTDEITGDQLRILSLDPSSDENAIVTCTLSTVPRDNCGPYEALSYYWGTGSPSHSVIVNNHSFAVRANLDDALRHIRLPDKQRHLWVDAICINQEIDSNQERNDQVTRMSDTYRNCSSVVAWLGRAQDRSAIAIEAIRVRASQFEGQSLLEVANSRVPLPNMVHGIDFTACISAVASFMSRPWFTRMWVFQEVCLAPRVTMLCGHDMINLAQFANFQLSLLGCPDVQRAMSAHGPEQTEVWWSILRLLDTPSIFVRQVLQVTQGELREGEDIDEIRNTTCVLLKLLWSTKNRRCQRPEDRFYALRGIAVDIDRNVLMPNYSDGIGVTYAKVVLAMLEHSKKLDVMCLCKGPTVPNAESRPRPSWAPDFEMHIVDPKNIAVDGYLTNFIGRDAWFHATGGSQAQPRRSNDGSELIVTGFDIGIIDASSSVKWLDGTIRQARAIVEARISGGADRTPTEDFWRTLITDRAADSSPAIAEVEGAEFKTWWDTYDRPTVDMDSIVRTADHYNRAYYIHGLQRVLFATITGWIGMGPNWLQIGDHVCLLAGAQTAFTLRPQAGKYHVVGETYVHGIMNGDHWRQLQGQGVQQTEFVLI